MNRMEAERLLKWLSSEDDDSGGADLHELETAKCFLGDIDGLKDSLPPDLLATAIAQAQADTPQPERATAQNDRLLPWAGRWAWAGGAAVAVVSMFVVGERIGTGPAISNVPASSALVVAGPRMAAVALDPSSAREPEPPAASEQQQQLAQADPPRAAPPSLPPAPAAVAVKPLIKPEQVLISGSLIRSAPIIGVSVASLEPPKAPEQRTANAPPNPVKETEREPVSTFSMDVDTASYSDVRRFLSDGDMPPVQAVRVEEMINYFNYHYAVPEKRTVPFEPMVAVYKTPWNPDTQILHIGIKGFEMPKSERPKANLVFLVDSSGSMNAPNKLVLLKQSFRLLVEQLRAEDRISIVTYGGSSGVVLPPTSGTDKARILSAINGLNARGAATGGEGVRLAYEQAETNFDRSAVNRVIVATDGHLNIGIADPAALESYVGAKRASGVFFSVFGFGTGNSNDLLMQKLAQAGGGVATYIDTINEAHKVIVDQIAGADFTIAKDVKIQVEFNAAKIAQYRLIGYEPRGSQSRDSADRVDAGDIGSGYEVTALYEITPVGSKALPVDHLHSGTPRVSHGSETDELATLRIRYKLPDETRARTITRMVENRDIHHDFAKLPSDLRFAAAVAAAGQLLRHDPYTKSFDYGRVLAIAESAKGEDEFGYRGEFISLIRRLQAVARATIAESTRSADAEAREPVIAAANPPKPMSRHQIAFEDYPPIARRLGEQGMVKVKYLVAADGSVGNCEVMNSSGSQRLDDAACVMVRRWVFKPATVESGTPVAMWLDADIAFQLR